METIDIQADVLGSITYKNLHLTHYSNGILFVDPSGDGELLLEDSEHYFAKIKELVGDNRVLILSDLTEYYFRVPKEAREELANNSYIKSIRVADAIVVKSVPNRLLVNFYIKYCKPKEPTKIFNSMEKAKEWLLSFDLE